METPSTARLRRRSFFEGTESDDSMTESIVLCESDLLSATALSASRTRPNTLKGAHMSSVDVNTALQHDVNASLRARAYVLLRDMWTQGILWLQEYNNRKSLYPAWTTRFPATISNVNACRPWILTAPLAWIASWKRDAPVKSYVYPTEYLTYASVGLVLLQMLVFYRYQSTFYDLRVDECVFHENLLASTELQQPLSSVNESPRDVALQFLERRLEQELNHAIHEPGQARLPWTCAALLHTKSDRAITQATELAFLWPNSQEVSISSSLKITSRMQVFVSESPLNEAFETQTEGLFAVMLPLNVWRQKWMASRFPELIFVKTEFALQQMLTYRQERRIEFDRNERVRGEAIYTVESTVLDRRQGFAEGPAAHSFGIYLLKTTVLDSYNRHIRKKWEEFLHVVVVTEADEKHQFTEELLTAWVAHPTWPMLHVRFKRSLRLCGSFQRLLNSKLKAFDETAEVKDAKGFQKRATKASMRHLNVDLVCEESANTPQEIGRLQNAIGVHVFPVPPELEEYEDTVLESLAVGAITMTYDTPIMQEWVPDTCGFRVGSFTYDTSKPLEIEEELEGMSYRGEEGELLHGTTALVKLPKVHATLRDIEQAIERMLLLDRFRRVAVGRAARKHYLRLRTHYLSAVAAMNSAVCEGDSDEIGETPGEIGLHRRRRVEIKSLQPFLY
ncbi:uncharacterized protein CCR75_007814 [Bremia lactucae]|uniref:Uncharacterized protein n=1 Tax=Bremia lactucae TaxID=4779 RepID=A0A976IM67_BRELC|nr:hypothetical protein CCR75_007814 [Bremia lactucae]